MCAEMTDTVPKGMVQIPTPGGKSGYQAPYKIPYLARLGVGGA
jgi:hypothetical protein